MWAILYCIWFLVLNPFCKLPPYLPVAAGAAGRQQQEAPKEVGQQKTPQTMLGRSPGGPSFRRPPWWRRLGCTQMNWWGPQSSNKQQRDWLLCPQAEWGHGDVEPVKCCLGWQLWARAVMGVQWGGPQPGSPTQHGRKVQGWAHLVEAAHCCQGEKAAWCFSGGRGIGWLGGSTSNGPNFRVEAEASQGTEICGCCAKDWAPNPQTAHR